MARKSPYIPIMVLSLLLMSKAASNLNAFIFREYTLEEVNNACGNVIFGKVTTIHREKMCFVVEHIENIKGTQQFEQLRISLAIGQKDSIERLMDKLRIDDPVVIFYVPLGQKRIEALGYVSGLWIRLFAVQNDQKTFDWHFNHVEKYMSRTFDGNTLELQCFIREILAGKEYQAPVDINAPVFHNYTLREIVHICSNVTFGKVTSIDRKKKLLTVDKTEDAKGKEQFKRIEISIAVGQMDSTKQLLDKLRTDAPIVIFYVPIRQKRIEALGYVSGLWVRLFAICDSPGNFKWYFTHIEKSMDRTFNDNTLKLQSLIRDILAEKKVVIE